MNYEGRLIANRYEILEKIGSGGMATVYKAKCLVLNRYVAVKILRDEYTTDIEFIKRFNSEAQSAASLTHPNIVSIYDVGNEGDVYYIVMELVQGKTLKEIITEDGVLPWKWSVNVAIQIASALDVAHKNNIIHRDIKPHNIIITEEGVAKVTDFGIAKAVSNSTVTAFGTTIGSVHYFSPEHAKGGYTDAKSDIYSLGVVMYEMVTGKVPFDSDTPVSVALKHMQEPAIEPIRIEPNLPISVNNIIMKALEKDVNVRYASATEIIRDLTACLKRPDDKMLGIQNGYDDMPTQRIQTINQKPKEDIKEDEEEDEKKPTTKIGIFFAKHKALKVITMILIAIVIFAGVMWGTMFVLDQTKEKDVAILNLVGKTLDEAKAEADKIKVVVEVSAEEYDKDVPVGSIISQDPRYRDNYKIKEKSTIKVVVSKGKETVELTKLVGLTKDDAINKIKELNLVEEVTEETSETVEKGRIIRQEPETGAMVDTKSIVKIFVSSGTGIKQVNAPDMLGQTESEARAVMEALGLKIVVKYETDKEKADGAVIKQDKDPNTLLDEGTNITVTVNKIPQISNGTVNIYLKSYTEYTKQTDVNGVAIPAKSVSVEVIVGDDTQYKQDVSEDTEKVTVQVKGIGNTIVKVKIDGVTVDQKTIDFSTSGPVLDFKK